MDENGSDTNWQAGGKYLSVKAFQHFFRGYGGKHSLAGSLPQILPAYSFMMSRIYQMPSAWCVCLGFRCQAPSSYSGQQDKQHDYIDEWTSTRLP